MRIERLIEEEGITIKWVHFPLHPDTPEKGRSLEDLFAGRGMDIPKMNAQMSERMAAEGLPYGTRTHTYNSRLAQELGSWADTQTGGNAFHDAVFRAYFVDARDVGDIDTLIDIARGVGLPEATAREVLESRSFKEVVDADWKRSHELGVTGVPTFVAGGQVAVGAQPYEAILGLVNQVRKT